MAAAIRSLLFTLTLIGSAASCKRNDNNDWSKESFILQDSKHQIEVNIPTELDSFYTWVDYNDTGCGCRRRYRFSSSKQPIFQESGFFQLEHPDSSYRVTFSHYYYPDCFGQWKVDLDHIVAFYKKGAEMDSVDLKVFSAKRININGIPFDVLAFRTQLVPRQKYPSTLIWGYASIDSVDLQVEYECAMKNCDLFIEKMGESLNSITVARRD